MVDNNWFDYEDTTETFDYILGIAEEWKRTAKLMEGLFPCQIYRDAAKRIEDAVMVGGNYHPNDHHLKDESSPLCSLCGNEFPCEFRR